jgi:hypothetical protein
MSWGEWFNTAAGAASLGSLILGAILGLISWQISQATDRLIKSTSEGTHTLIAQTTTNTQQVLERMDQRADERHREVIQAIQALKN